MDHHGAAKIRRSISEELASRLAQATASRLRTLPSPVTGEDLAGRIALSGNGEAASSTALSSPPAAHTPSEHKSHVPRIRPDSAVSEEHVASAIAGSGDDKRTSIAPSASPAIAEPLLQQPMLPPQAEYQILAPTRQVQPSQSDPDSPDSADTTTSEDVADAMFHEYMLPPCNGCVSRMCPRRLAANLEEAPIPSPAPTSTSRAAAASQLGENAMSLRLQEARVQRTLLRLRRHRAAASRTPLSVDVPDLVTAQDRRYRELYPEIDFAALYGSVRPYRPEPSRSGLPDNRLNPHVSPPAPSSTGLTASQGRTAAQNYLLNNTPGDYYQQHSERMRREERMAAEQARNLVAQDVRLFGAATVSRMPAEWAGYRPAPSRLSAADRTRVMNRRAPYDSSNAGFRRMRARDLEAVEEESV